MSVRSGRAGLTDSPSGGDGSARSPTLVVGLCLAVAALDGLDVPILGLAVPAISREWGLPSSAFVAPTALGLVGMGIGTSVLGAMGDRHGARRMLVASTLLFGLATALLCVADGMSALSSLRFLAGIGLGGALPNALSLLAVHAPPGRRVFWLASVGTAMQVGGVAAGLLAGAVLATRGWRALMLVGGLLPILLAALVMLLVRVDRTAMPPTSRRGAAGSEALSALFAGGRGRTTLMFWTCFALLYLGLYLVPTWLPAALAGTGLPMRIAGMTLAAFNLAGIAGGLTMGVVIGRFGVRKPLIAVGLLGAAWAVVPSLLLRSPGTTQPLLVASMGLQGLFAVATMSALVAYVAESYAAEVRGTGVGAALAAARVGAIASSFLGAAIVAAGHPSVLFAAIGGSLAACALLCALIPSRHPSGAR